MDMKEFATRSGQLTHAGLDHTRFSQTKNNTSAAKPDPFFQVKPNFGVELCQVGPQGHKMGPIGSG